MYFILDVDRVNLAAVGSIKLGIGFPRPTIRMRRFKRLGGWIADRFGVRWTSGPLFRAVTTLLTGAVTGLATLFAAATSPTG